MTRSPSEALRACHHGIPQRPRPPRMRTLLPWWKARPSAWPPVMPRCVERDTPNKHPCSAAIAFALAVCQGRQTRDASGPPCMGTVSVGTGPTRGPHDPVGRRLRFPPRIASGGDTGWPDRSRAHRARPVFSNTALGSKAPLDYPVSVIPRPHPALLEGGLSDFVEEWIR